MMYPYIMLRTQISLTDEERAALDAVSARTGRSISALIRDAVDATYGVRSADADIDAMRQAFGSWKGRCDGDGDQDGEAWVERMRSGRRLRGSA